MKIHRRFSIAWLMTIVLIFSLGLGALQSQSAVWAGVVYLLTYAVLLLAVVGAVCRTGSERTGWLGFALLGIAYFKCSSYLEERPIKLPTTMLLDLIKPDGLTKTNTFGDPFRFPFENYWLIGHCLWSLLAAMAGGLLSLALFPSPRAEPVELDIVPSQPIMPARAKWYRIAAISLAIILPLLAMILVSPRTNPTLWAGGIYLGTWLLLGVTVLGFACGRGKRRMIWLGAALFGLGYMVLNRTGDRFREFSYVHLVADDLLESTRPMLPKIVREFPAKSPAIARENERIWKILDQKIPMRFRQETSLEDFLAYLRATTKDAHGRELPVYVNPQALQDADETMQSTIQIDLEDCLLGPTLRIALEQLSLSYDVRDGMILVTSDPDNDLPYQLDHYLLVGHSVLALLCAGLGAVLVPLVTHRQA